MWSTWPRGESVAAFFARIPRLDYLFAPGAAYQVASIHSDDHEAVESPFRSKFWGQVTTPCAKPRPRSLRTRRHRVLMSGAASARPIRGASAYAACNAAIEGLGRSLALDLAPVRVNTVSPGTIDSDLWQRRPAELRAHAFDSYSCSNRAWPGRRRGRSGRRGAVPVRQSAIRRERPVRRRRLRVALTAAARVAPSSSPEFAYHAGVRRRPAAGRRYQ
ncbi:SDR family oxidoreductase [Cupriavidus basilensis]